MMHFALLVAGFTYLLTQSGVFAAFRKWVADDRPTIQALVYCPACAGFWIGVLLHTVWPFPELVIKPVEAGIGACALMAVWSYYVPSEAWEIEQGRDAKEATEET